MSVVKELLRIEEDGSLSFGNYRLSEKTKLNDFEYNGDIYKVKTFREITKLEKNGMLLYESEPGTAVMNFTQTEDNAAFAVEGGDADIQIILGLEEDTIYRVSVNGGEADAQKTNMGGKLVISIPKETAGHADVLIRKIG